jgi:o-succinylbenzoate---CoA ligase
MIDWYSKETHALWNPRLPDEEREALERLLRGVPALEGHVWIATSGTSGAFKLVALSKPAILASAAAVNAHLGATARDVWCCVLPTFHVGGLGIHARAALSGSRVVSMEWDAQRFVATVDEEGVTLSALVPAQVRDLTKLSGKAPASVRSIIVGGGALSTSLYEAARERGWPVLPSYGLTEASSQVATAIGDSPELRLLSHLQCRITNGRIAIKGPSLFSGYALAVEGMPRFVDPRQDGWFLTEDQGELQGDRLVVYGRSGEFVKIGGESVDLTRLDAILDAERGTVDAAIFAAPDPRLGSVIHLAVAGPGGDLEARFNARVLPFERIRRTHAVDRVPRTELGKLRRGALLEILGRLLE